MRSFKYAVLSVLLAAGVFFLVLYTSCSKDSCKTVNCLYGGSCNGGACSCLPGTDGISCQILYRQLYANTYVGNAVYTNSADLNVVHIDTNSTLVFSQASDSNFNHMLLVWNRASGKPVHMDITLSNNSASGSSFLVTSATSQDTSTYTGGGVVNANAASLNLTQTNPNSPSVIISLSNFIRQ